MQRLGTPRARGCERAWQLGSASLLVLGWLSWLLTTVRGPSPLGCSGASPWPALVMSTGRKDISLATKSLGRSKTPNGTRWIQPFWSTDGSESQVTDAGAP